MGRHGAAHDRDWQGDPAAFADLVRRWQRPVARYLARVVADEGRVQDLCQEVFLRVYLARERYRESGAFSTWLFQIALNVGRDALRCRDGRNEALRGDEPAGTPPPELMSEAADLNDLVRRAVAELPPPLREVLALRHDQGMSFEEMARVLGVPASTLKSRFAAALSRLRGRLAPVGRSLEGL